MNAPVIESPLELVSRRAARRRKLMILGIVISSLPTAVVVLAFPVGNLFVESSWNQFRDQWEARGETFDLPSPSLEPVADEDNFAKAPIIAEWYRRAAARRHAGHDHAGHDHAAEENAEAPEKRESPARLETLTVITDGSIRIPKPKPPLAYLSGNPVDLRLHVPPADQSATLTYLLNVYAPHREVIDELFEAATRPQAHYPLNADRPYATDLAHLPAIINASHSLRVLTLALVDSGEAHAARAADHVVGTLRVIRHGTECPGMPSFTIRTLALESAGLEPVWQALHRRGFNEGQWRRIDAELRAFDFGPRLLDTLRFERAAMIQQVEAQFLTTSARPFSIPPAWVQLVGLQEYGELTQRYWFTGPGGDQILRDRPRIDQLESIEALIDEKPATWENFVVNTGVIPVAEFARHAQQIEIIRDQALIAIALERHRLSTGNFPETLSGLIPQWLEELPVNAETGHPPRYERLPDGSGYRLRNLGEEGETGDPTWVMPPANQDLPEVVKPS